MKFTKSSTTSGAWAKAAELMDVKEAKIVSEARRVESQFKTDQGETKYQTVAKVRFKGKADELNVSLNRATVDGLVDAFGDDSVGWQGHVLRVQTEKVQVAGKNMRALYLIPEGYVLSEDQNGYTVIVREGTTEPQTVHIGPSEEGPAADIPS